MKLKKIEKKNKIQKLKKENNKLITKKIESQLNLLLKGQEINQKELRLGFLGLASQNQELLDLNQKLTQQLETVVTELNQIKQEREEKEIRKQAHQNRKRLPKRAPMTHDIYTELIRALSKRKVKTCSLSSNGYWNTNQ